MNDWNWTEATEEEFESKRMAETYYRIYHNVDGNSVVDYKFWAKNDDDALLILNRFIEDHKDGNEYFYSTSGYYVNSNKQRFDTMEEMHEAWKKEPYDEESRKYDIEKISSCLEKCKSKERDDELGDYKKTLDSLINKIAEYRIAKDEFISKCSETDMSTASEEEMDKLNMSSIKINDMFYDISETNYLINTNHNKSERWSLYGHVLEDLKFNLPKIIEDKQGYPCTYTKKAAESLGVELDKYGQVKNDSDENKVDELAVKMWNDNLQELLDTILGFDYYSTYGIIDDKDEQLKKFVDEKKPTIPYKSGTNNEIDYAELSKKSEECWNKIWNWMKKDGMSLWT